MVLLVLYLYQTLPQLLPRTTLDFAGKLGDKQVSPCLAAKHLTMLCTLSVL
jgi:hypothetical protein